MLFARGEKSGLGTERDEVICAQWRDFDGLIAPLNDGCEILCTFVYLIVR